ncbi:hypothetical protein FQR65_LT04055 [Abscondita terminalis]|nr:hypothetical protein FQR65_LT04055 [Abscondita terminalis]
MIGIILCLLIWSGDCSKLSYENYKVYNVTPKSEEEVNILRKLEEVGSYTFWNKVAGINASVNILVSSFDQNEFESLLKNFDYHILIENVQDLINKSEFRPRSVEFNWLNYHTLDEINNWLIYLSQTYPKVKLVKGGVSYENRTILGVKITFKSCNQDIVIEGGSHAREWIGPATVTYILNQVITNNDPKIRSILTRWNWYFFPVFNPDGYHHTWTTDRLWRKTRTPYDGCFGADLNRNWGYHWMDGGSSNIPCNDLYAGPTPFSESESKSLSTFINGISNKIQGYITFHSYLQLILIPFGHAGLEVPSNNAELMRIANITVQAISKRYGTQYIYGNIPQAIYVASGSSLDWILGTHRHIRYAFAFELRDKGQYGFCYSRANYSNCGRSI